MKFLVVVLMVFVLAVTVYAAPTADDDLPTQRECVSGKSYYDGCNNCWCTGGVTACTYKACFQRHPDGTITSPKSLPPPEDYWTKN